MDSVGQINQCLLRRLAFFDVFIKGVSADIASVATTEELTQGVDRSFVALACHFCKPVGITGGLVRHLSS